MRSRARGLPRIHLISLGVILVGCLFVLLRRGNFEEGEAFAATPRKSAATENASDGGAPLATMAMSAADTSPPHDVGDAGSVSGESEPIDLAIAPDGVPYHSQGARFRSPFAKPNPGPTVRVTVGI